MYRLDPKDIPTDALDRALVRKALEALIQHEIKRLPKLTKESTQDTARDNIAHATDLLKRFI